MGLSVQKENGRRYCRAYRIDVGIIVQLQRIKKKQNVGVTLQKAKECLVVVEK